MTVDAIDINLYWNDLTKKAQERLLEIAKENRLKIESCVKNGHDKLCWFTLNGDGEDDYFE